MPLDCSHIRNEFSALLDNELNPEDRELVEEHLSDCSECLRELHGYKVVSDAYRYHHPVKAPDDFEERFRAALVPIGRRPSSSLQRWGLALAACGVGLISLFVWQAREAHTPSMELASSQAAGKAESAVSDPAPQAMMFDAPAETGAPESGLNQGSLPESAVLSDGIAQPAEAATLREQDADLSSPERGAGFGGGAALQAAPPADSVATTPPPMLDRRTERADEATTADEGADTDSLAMASKSRELSNLESAAESDTVAPVAAQEETPQRDAPTLARRVPATAPPALHWRKLSFSLVDGVWRQEGYTNEAVIKVTIPSGLWNSLLDEHPDLATLCDHGHPVIVALDDVWYQFTVPEIPTEDAAPKP